MHTNPDQLHWRRILAEGVAIVLSILLAFWIDASWNSRIDRGEERESLSALQADFSATILELDRATAVHRARLSAVEILLGTGGDTQGVVSTDSIASLLNIAQTPTTIDPPTIALNSLIASGRLSFISDKVLRDELARWNGLLEDHEGTQELLVSEITSDFAPWLRSRVLVERGEWRSSRFSSDFSALFTDPRFDSQLIAVAHRTTIVVGELESLRSTAERILTLLGGEWEAAT